ncbi:MAG: efflux RND transporter periplasmic adaptor subunit [SAR86 cluster bacterium]|jgi:multidrug efflux pump subunit AcrA (membrane-fusion protein)|nr:efflux RND transporter periplasmic adaptor subunit [SAR86 cluster bacterium]
MKLRRTYRTSALAFLFTIVWMASGFFKDDNLAKKPTNNLETMSAVTVLSSEAVMKSKIIKASGYTEADKLVKVRAEINGRVISTPVKQGDYVKKGDLLCQLYIAGREAYPKIQAPFDGLLEEVSAESGDYLNIGSTCATLIDPNPMILVGEVSEKEIDLVKVGIPAKAKLVSGSEIKGVVSFVGTSANKNTRRFKIEITVNNDDGAIRDGLSAELFIQGAKIEAHKISPSILLLGTSGELGIRTVNNFNEVQFQKVTILEDSMDGIWVSGLPPKTRIITVGQEYVFQGQTVKTQEATIPPKA